MLMVLMFDVDVDDGVDPSLSPRLVPPLPPPPPSPLPLGSGDGVHTTGRSSSRAEGRVVNTLSVTASCSVSKC